MTSTPWTAAPACTLGLGGFAVPADGRFVAVGASDKAFDKTFDKTFDKAFDKAFDKTFDMAFDMVATAGDAARVRPAVAHLVPAERQPRIAPTYIAQNDGTTLGIPSSRRPQS
jgi:hypothetical protein